MWIGLQRRIWLQRLLLVGRREKAQTEPSDACMHAISTPPHPRNGTSPLGLSPPFAPPLTWPLSTPLSPILGPRSLMRTPGTGRIASSRMRTMKTCGPSHLPATVSWANTAVSCVCGKGGKGG